ncbi:MAG: zinc-dependent alcohol dehydrogenase [Candidatus Latescibacterota bacterium]|jgi:threonine dehydrogenase-like Zn-dependent dehydrogenase
MKILQYDAPGNPVLKDVPTPEPEAHQVLIKVLGITTCPHWDIHIMDGVEMLPGLALTYPYTAGQPGHEAMGEVVKVGSQVTEFEPGMRVAAWRDQGQNRTGAYAQYAVFDADSLLQTPTLVPERIASLELAMCLQVSFDRLIKTDCVENKRFGVSGLGPAGLIAIQMARAYGAREVVAFDPMSERREMAEMLGADQVYAPQADLFPEGRFTEQALDTALDCTGLKVSIEYLMARTRETVSIFGVLREEVSFGPKNWNRNFTLMGYGMHNKDAAKRALHLIVTGAVNLSPLVTHSLPLSRYREGVDLLRKKEAIKICFDPWA